MKHRLLFFLLILPGAISAQVKATRIGHAPLITVRTSTSLAGNVNGPTLIRVPDWVQHPLGHYYLYFANHKGKFIRLAYSDAVTGPWKIYEPGVLQVKETAFYRPQPDPSGNHLYTHVASPDIYIDNSSKKIILWAHGMWTNGEPWAAIQGDKEAGIWLRKNGYEQYTQSFESVDGIHFTPHPAITKVSYLRVFPYHGSFFSVARLGRVGRSEDPVGEFTLNQDLFRNTPYAGRVRHTALLRRGDRLYVFFTAIGDTPERILVATVDLKKPWTEWEAVSPTDVLTSESSYECANLPASPSHAGDIDVPVHQLRDPGIFQENGNAYLLYSTCGEQGLALAELTVR